MHRILRTDSAPALILLTSPGQTSVVGRPPGLRRPPSGKGWDTHERRALRPLRSRLRPAQSQRATVPGSPAPGIGSGSAPSDRISYGMLGTCGTPRCPYHAGGLGNAFQAGWRRAPLGVARSPCPVQLAPSYAREAPAHRPAYARARARAFGATDVTFEEDVLRLNQQGLSETEIAERLRAKKTTVRRVLKEVGEPEDVASEGDSADSVRNGEPVEEEGDRTSTEFAVQASMSVASWLPPLPVIPQPRADQRDCLRPILRYFEDNAGNMRWKDPWDLVLTLWDQACRLGQSEKDLAASRALLAQAQGQLGAWGRWKDDRVRNEVEKRTAERRHELDEEYRIRLETLHAEATRERGAKIEAVTETGRLRDELRQTKWALQQAREVNGELYGQVDSLMTDNEELRAGCDLALKGWAEREGLTPDARGMNVLFDRCIALWDEQIDENLKAWGSGQPPRRAQLGGR